MKNKSKWRQCGSKNRYRHEHDAQLYRKKFEKARGDKLRIYYCYVCNGYHLTSTAVAYKYEIEFD